jgi:hypothetical protein
MAITPMDIVLMCVPKSPLRGSLPSQQETNMEKTRNHRPFSLLLGSTLGAAIGWGLSGGWYWLELVGVPVERNSYAFIGLAIGGVLGIGWGYLVTWPPDWWAAGLFGGLGGSLAIICLSAGINAFEWILIHGEESEFAHLILLPVMGAVALAALAFPPAIGAALLIRWPLKVIEPMSQYKSKLRHLVGPSAVLILIAFGLILTRLPYLLGDPSNVDALKAAQQYAESQNWQNYALEVIRADSGSGTIHIHLSNGEIHKCDGWIWGDDFCEPCDKK